MEKERKIEEIKLDSLNIPDSQLYSLARELSKIIRRYDMLPIDQKPTDRNLLNLINSKSDMVTQFILPDGDLNWTIRYTGITTIVSSSTLKSYNYGISLPTTAYVSFGTPATSNAWGFRSNNGTMQYKHEGGSWTTFSTAAGGVTLHNLLGNLDFSVAAHTGVLQLIHGGLETSLSDPSHDAIVFWDDSKTSIDWLHIGTNLSISGTTLNASGGGVFPTLTENYIYRGNSTNSPVETNIIQVESDGDVIITLGDAVGAKKLTVRDSANATRFIIDSDGNIKVYGEIGFDEIYDNGDSGSSATIDWRLGNKQIITTTGNCTLAFVDPANKCCLQLLILHDISTASYSYVFPDDLYFFTDYEFVATTNVANAVDILSIIYTGIVGKEYVGYGMTNA